MSLSGLPDPGQLVIRESRPSPTLPKCLHLPTTGKALSLNKALCSVLQIDTKKLKVASMLERRRRIYREMREVHQQGQWKPASAEHSSRANTASQMETGLLGASDIYGVSLSNVYNLDGQRR